MSITITELLTEVGDDKLNFQLIHQCMTGITKKKSGESEVKFLTDAMTPDDVMSGGGRVGLVIWIERDDYRDAINKIKEQKQ